MLDFEDWPFPIPAKPPGVLVTRSQKYQASSIRRPASKQRTSIVNPFIETHSEKPMRGPLKRNRALEDLEGDDTCSMQRKKRRLRHSFATSRLSEPYATPTTYIPSRKALREGIWARQKVAGRNLLRKAAALNSFSKKRRESQVIGRRLRSNEHSPGACTRRSRSKSPSPHRSSPPSLRSSAFSDFEVFDFEEDSSLEDDGEWTSLGMINSDFSKIQEADWDAVQEYGFDSSSTLDLDDIYSFDPGGKGKAIGLIMENELQNEVSCAPGVL